MDFNAILRGAQLGFIGMRKALENGPTLSQHHFRHFWMLAGATVAVWFATQILITVPLKIFELFVWLFSWIFWYNPSSIDESINRQIQWFERWILALPFLGLLFLRYVYPKPLDDIFIQSMQFVDQTYVQKHSAQGERELRPSYSASLNKYPYHSSRVTNMHNFFRRYYKRLRLFIPVYLASSLPVVGPLALPMAGFYTLLKNLGLPAALVFSVIITAVPPLKPLATLFLESFFSSRTLTRELLEPYFARVKFTPKQRALWFKERESVLFGFGLVFYWLLRLPFLGVLFFGVAQASAAFLIQKVSDIPPEPPTTKTAIEAYAQSQIAWKNKKHFLILEGIASSPETDAEWNSAPGSSSSSTIPQGVDNITRRAARIATEATSSLNPPGGYPGPASSDPPPYSED